jgi:integrase
MSRYNPTPETVAHYRTRLPRWIAWCGQNGVDPLRPSADDVGLYLLALHDQGLAYGTIATDKAIIRRLLLDAAQTLPVTADRAVAEAMASIKAMQRDRVIPRKAAVDMAMAEALLHACDRDPNRPLGARDKAILSLSWHLCVNMRRLVTPTVADVMFYPLRPGTMTVLLDGAPHLVTDYPPWQPTVWLREWLAAAGIEDGPLFRPVRVGGLVQAGPMRAADSGGRIIKKRAEQAGLDPAQISGISLRRGRMTAEFVAERRFDQLTLLSGLTAQQVFRTVVPAASRRRNKGRG